MVVVHCIIEEWKFESLYKIFRQRPTEEILYFIVWVKDWGMKKKWKTKQKMDEPTPKEKEGKKTNHRKTPSRVQSSGFSLPRQTCLGCPVERSL